MFTLEGLDHVALTVRDVARSATWYQEVLGLERVFADVWGEVPTVVVARGTGLALFPASVDNPQPIPGSDTLAVRHIAFQATRANYEAAKARLSERGIAYSFEDHIVSHSIYFRDPDGHRLEITTYEL